MLLQWNNKRKNWILKHSFLRSVFMFVGVVVVVFSFHSGVGFSNGDNAATSDFFFVFPHPLG